MLSGKYFVDEAYERFIGRPLFWISDRVFLQLRRPRAPRRLAARARRARARARPAVLGRVQNGNLHLYAFLVLVGIVASLAWSWRHV